MMQIIVWIAIILVIIILIRLLRKWIRRIIFILILLCIAFFIYGIFSPSGASRLWYNFRTIPQRITSRFSNQNFLDYDNYKGISIKGANEIDDNKEENNDTKEEIIPNVNEKNDEKTIEENDKDNNKDNNKESTDVSDTSDGQKDNEGKAIRSFSGAISLSLINLKQLNVKESSIKGQDNDNILTGYSKSDLIGVINSYVDKNLDDDTDILVTVEYNEDNSDPQKIILQTQPKTLQTNSSNKLTAKELKAAEEISAILF